MEFVRCWHLAGWQSLINAPKLHCVFIALPSVEMDVYILKPLSAQPIFDVFKISCVSKCESENIHFHADIPGLVSGERRKATLNCCDRFYFSPDTSSL